ncbi:hypothetical protein MKZ38_009638 [Zalerion maritima]|uniref:Uncharacterized protein n=1 Tax=Zalerion maritima TaxID=339359 RepID=A0AAD5WUY8_9PEZI|nr:hypothetical protein MKZ38_009638 [Zalerion maritima]
MDENTGSATSPTVEATEEKGVTDKMQKLHLTDTPSAHIAKPSLSQSQALCPPVKLAPFASTLPHAPQRGAIPRPLVSHPEDTQSLHPPPPVNLFSLLLYSPNDTRKRNIRMDTLLSQPATITTAHGPNSRSSLHASSKSKLIPLVARLRVAKEKLPKHPSQLPWSSHTRHQQQQQQQQQQVPSSTSQPNSQSEEQEQGLIAGNGAPDLLLFSLSLVQNNEKEKTGPMRRFLDEMVSSSLGDSWDVPQSMDKRMSMSSL